MKSRIAWLLMGYLVALSLVLASCAQPASVIPPAPIPPVESGRVWLDEHTCVAGGNGEPIVLVDNPSASNPTWEQLFSYLQDDETDAQPYTSTYVCADFAETLHNNAEVVGIRTAFVVLLESDHCLNAFETTDEGLIYIDCTGKSSKTSFPTVPVKVGTFGDVSSWDKVAYIQVGRPLGFISLENAERYGFQYYPGYKKWMEDKEVFDQLFNEYVSSIPAPYPTYPFYDYYEREMKEKAHTYHEGLLNDLRRYETMLGGFWEQGDTVKGVKIVWESQ